MRFLCHRACTFMVLIGLAISWPSLSAKSFGQQAETPSSGLKIVVLEGEDGVNIIKKKTAVKPVVEVRDKNNLPVAGVAVLFFLPRGGAGGVFANGKRELSVMTDANGRAAAGQFRPTGKGSFKIQVRASYQGQTVTTTIAQTNFATVAAATQAGKVAGSSQGATSASSGASSGGSGAAGGSGSAASGAAGAGGAAAGTAGGLSTAAIAGIAAGGAAAAGLGAAAATGALGGGSSSSSTKNCSSQLSQVQTDDNAVLQLCSTLTLVQRNFNQCYSLLQKELSDMGLYCTCNGNSASGMLTSQEIQFLQTVAPAIGLTYPSSCR